MRLTLNIPEDVWHRLADEAAAKGLTIGMHGRNLITARDARLLAKTDNPAGARASTGSSNRK